MGRLYRSRRDKWFSGLLGGLGAHFGISTTALRILTIISVPFTSGATIFIYLIASLVISKEPYEPFDPYFHNNGWNGNGGAGGYGGYGGGNPGNPGQPGYGYGSPRPQQPPFGGNSFNANNHNPYGSQSRNSGFGANESSNLDSMMEDIEKKAMKKELEELRKKLSNYEKGEV